MFGHVENDVEPEIAYIGREAEYEFGGGGYRQKRWLLLVMAILSLVQIVASVVTLIVGCHFMCLCCKNCCCRYDVTVTQQVIPLSALSCAPWSNEINTQASHHRRS